MPTRRSSSTRSRAMRRCSLVPTRSRRRGASSIRSSRRGPTALRPPSPTTTRGPGDRRTRTSSSHATAVAGGGSDPVTAPSSEFATRPEPTLRWSARAHSIAEIESELIRIWEAQDGTIHVDDDAKRHRAARTNVMNLIVVARRPEAAERCAATVQALTGRHPSRTVVIQSADPDGPSWLDARIEAHCVMPRPDAPETCAETILVTCGGEAGRHLSAIATPLIIHDLPVTVWWPGEPPLTSPAARDLLAGADRLVVDGSTWSGDGLMRLREMAVLADTTRLAISDFALVRQSRWREAIASIFDDPDFLPYLPFLRRVAVTYATHDESGAAGSTNLVKPIYHVGWLASRLGLSVVRPLAEPATGRGGASAGRP